MSKFICNLHAKNNWNITLEEVITRTFITEIQAREWYEKQYLADKLKFDGFIFDGNYMKNYVSFDSEEIGYITKYPDPNEPYC